MSTTIVNDGQTEPWLAYLDNEYTSCEEGNLEYDLGVIIRDLLLPLSSDGDSNSYADAARAAAQRVDAYYWEKNLDSGPLFKFQKDWGIFDFLEFLYEIVLDMAMRLPYDDVRQDTLIRFVAELGMIPPKPFTRWNATDQGNRLVEPDDDFFSIKLDDRWRGHDAGDGWEEKLSPPDWKERCDRWVNFSSFFARAIQTRSFEGHGVADMTKYPRLDIPRGLEEEMPAGVKRDCRVMVAARYIALCARFLDEELVLKFEEGRTPWGLRRWKLWGDKLAEMEENKDFELAPEVRAAVHEARAKIVSRHPELFY